MVARAMLLRPRLIVADEPVSMVDASLRATILESIRRMKQELGISVVYITHDLTTAYQIADNILVMYKGSVVEAGSVEQVIRDPKHPYTQLLVSSIPQPDPSLPWGAEGEIAGDPESMEVAATGCKFVDRCPLAFEPCAGQRPPTVTTSTHRARRHAFAMTTSRWRWKARTWTSSSNRNSRRRRPAVRRNRPRTDARGPGP